MFQNSKLLLSAKFLVISPRVKGGLLTLVCLLIYFPEDALALPNRIVLG